MHMTLFADFRKLPSRESLLAIDGVDSRLNTLQKRRRRQLMTCPLAKIILSKDETINHCQ